MHNIYIYTYIFHCWRKASLQRFVSISHIFTTIVIEQSIIVDLKMQCSEAIWKSRRESHRHEHVCVHVYPLQARVTYNITTQLSQQRQRFLTSVELCQFQMNELFYLLWVCCYRLILSHNIHYQMYKNNIAFTIKKKTVLMVNSVETLKE